MCNNSQPLFQRHMEDTWIQTAWAPHLPYALPGPELTQLPPQPHQASRAQHCGRWPRWHSDSPRNSIVMTSPNQDVLGAFSPCPPWKTCEDGVFPFSVSGPSPLCFFWMLRGDAQGSMWEDEFCTLPLKLAPLIFHGCVEFYYLDTPLFIYPCWAIPGFPGCNHCLLDL